jgi:type VI secretion system protein ImpM
MWGANIGFFGKLPSHGDFIERRLNPQFRTHWDEWMQQSMYESQQELAGRWLDCYLTSPIWRFFLSDGIAGSASYAGVLLPSVDRVGRYFPFTVVVELPVGTLALEFARRAADWFAAVEQLCADALQNPDFELAQFDTLLQESGQQLEGADQLTVSESFPGRAAQWHWPTQSVDALGDALSSPLMQMAQAALRPMSMWWTEGSQLVGPGVLLVRALPRPDSFAALLAGTWDDGRWAGEVSGLAAPPMEEVSESVQLEVLSAAATDPGTVREDNQDSYALADGNRLWAVADGMGGHSNGGVASRMVVDAIQAVEPAASLSACIQSMNIALSRVNSDLRRQALSADGVAESGSTVVALAIRGNECGVCWAGDSRAYVFRAESLQQLTRDHKEEAVTLTDLVSGPQSAITRAVGGHDELELDQISELVSPGDRFLLCSDGLYTTLDEQQLIAGLTVPAPQEACDALIRAAREAGASDNVTALIVDIRASEAPAA